MSLPTTEAEWDQSSGDDLLFDGDLSNGESSTEVKQVFTNLSTAVLGQPYQMTAGYAYDQSYYNGYAKWHAGIDFGATAGTSVQTVLGGTVAWTWSSATDGAFIAVNSSDGRQWVYGHLQDFNGLALGSSISAGQVIGQIGNQSGANHLHLEVRTPPFEGTGGASPDQNFILNATISPLQAFWEARGGTITPSPGTPTAGNDNILGSAESDNINSLEGDDTVTGAAGNDTFYGNSGHDILYGDDGNDVLYGWDGNDTVIGGAGDDVLDAFYYSGLSGNGEVDYLRGDTGADTFVIGDHYGKGYLGSSWAIIEDFNWLEDNIKVHGTLDQYQLVSGSQYDYSANDTAIVLSGTNEVLAVALGVSSLNGSIQLSERDFIAT